MQNQDRRIVGELTERMMQAPRRRRTTSRRRAAATSCRRANAFFEKSAVVLGEGVDIDVFGIDARRARGRGAAVHRARRSSARCARRGPSTKSSTCRSASSSTPCVQNAYGDDMRPPREVVVPELPDDAEALESWLGTLAERKVRLRVAQRGDKAALLETATQNARQTLMLYKTRRSADFTTRSQALEDIQEALGMADAPLRIECYDVSHLSGTNIVASMVVFEDGLPRKDEYRRFTIPRVDRRHRLDPPGAHPSAGVPRAPCRRRARRRRARGDGDANGDDAAETSGRRKKFAYRPNLLVVDGGQPQVAAAARALAESGVDGIYLCGIAKRLEEIWTPGADFPVILPRNSDALFLFQRVRDEAHRFAITHQRQTPQARHRLGARRDPRARAGAGERAAAHFGSVDATPSRDRGRDRRGEGHRPGPRRHGHRSPARRRRPGAPVGWDVDTRKGSG